MQGLYNENTLIRFILNQKEITTSLPPGMVLLDFIRYHQHQVGTKVGCREGDCGACTVLVGELVNNKPVYRTMTSCLVPLGNVQGKHIVTVEGISEPNSLNAVQELIAGEGATQCGFCTPGFVMSMTGFCLSHYKPSVDNAVAAIDGNICRCTGYKSIQRAAAKLATIMQDKKDNEQVIHCISKKILPSYFTGIGDWLISIHDTEKNKQLTDLAALPSRPHVVGGGTDLYVQKHDEMTHAGIRFVFDHPSLSTISTRDGKCFFGPSTTVTELTESVIFRDIFPRFDQYAKLISSTPIRNMATIAGNFINASPIGDMSVFFLALNTRLVLNRAGSKRVVALRSFYKGYKQLDLLPGEHLEEIWFDLPGKDALFHFEKVSKRTHLDIATVNTAACIEVKDNIMVKAAISAGGVNPIPTFLQATSGYLTGKHVNESTIKEAVEVAQKEISPISDVRGSASYKRLLLGQLIKSHFISLFPKLEIAKLIN